MNYGNLFFKKVSGKPWDLRTDTSEITNIIDIKIIQIFESRVVCTAIVANAILK